MPPKKSTKWTKFLKKEGRTTAYGVGLCLPKKGTEAHKELKEKYSKFKPKKTKRGRRRRRTQG